MKGYCFIYLYLIPTYAISQLVSDTTIVRKDSTFYEIIEQVSISASRISETIFKSPISIEQINASFIKNRGSTSYIDALENIKGIHVITPSLGFKVINSRGFSNTTNVRFTQLIDGIDNQAPHIGAPIANAMGANELDIKRIELIPGTASALYGLNAINGLVNILTKNPFDEQGLSIQQLTGLNHINEKDGSSPQVYSMNNLRYARSIHSKFAFKINTSYFDAKDWKAVNYSDLAADLNLTNNLTGLSNPAFDAVNSYGNESSNRQILNLKGKQYVVSRTGYNESDISDYNIKNFKGDFGLFHRPTLGHEFSLTYKFALINTIYQRSNRFRLEDYVLQQVSLDYHTSVFQLRSFITHENSGKSYNLRSLAENMDRAFKTDEEWFNDYTTSFNESMNNGLTISSSHQQARINSDKGRFEPGTSMYQTKKEELIKINNWDEGAALRVKANLFHSEGLLNWDKLFPLFFQKIDAQILSGFDYRNYFIIPDGNYFINPLDSTKNLTYQKSGAFIQLNKVLFKQKLKINATIRADKADYFDWKFNPRFTLFYSPKEYTNFRVSYQSGYRFPSVFEGFSNVNSGGVKRIGGLKIMSNGIFENSYTKVSIDAFQTKVNSDINTLNITKNQAIEDNKKILQKNPYTYLKPEFIRSLEFGIRAITFKKKLFIDVDFYYNAYDNFIAQIEVSTPKTNITDSIPLYLYSKSKQNRYRLWTNSKSKIYTYGASLGLNFRYNKQLSMHSALTFSKLNRIDDLDGFEDGFNTPTLNLNASIILENFWKKMSASLTTRYQSKYDYVSFLVNGEVPAFCLVDAQINYYFEKTKSVLKIGATNLFNKYYYSIVGGPNIGGVYYVSITLFLD